ncbi:hypothetical protein [Weissella confusa]|uniref:hypothetical protein n=1 Tax=Weissella confusa TaxID=1583 RepID=UPI002A74CE13|nr:hypothetical protein [Weissella confusa]MDY2512884.1 hypothetical protein [Weissella confusa]
MAKKQVKKLEEQVAAMQLKLKQAEQELEAAKEAAKADLGGKLMKYFGTDDVTEADDLLANLPAYVPFNDEANDSPEVPLGQPDSMLGGGRDGGLN